MKILITGGCGFIGTNLAIYLKKNKFNVESLDNLSRKGSQYNLKLLRINNIINFKIDIKNFKKIRKLKKYDLIIHCCAEASIQVLKKDVERVFYTNLVGTFNLLKKVSNDKSKIIFLSSSRVYPIANFRNLIKKKNYSKEIISEIKNINGPRSIYGFTKLASEMLIEEFSYSFKIKYIINRCGVISGPLQYGKQDQGFVSLWVWSHMTKNNLKYIGYGGSGQQVRDVLHIEDLCFLILAQIKNIDKINNKLFNVGGSIQSFTTLRKLTKVCQMITKNKVKIFKKSKTSNYDIPFYISNISKVSNTYKWKPKKNIVNIVSDIYSWMIKDKNKIKRYFNCQ